MPLNPRERFNNVFGTTTDNPLTSGATSFNSMGLANLGVIATKHATITFDPLRQFGNPEIVIVTAHTSNATIATITRGAYNTTNREHPQGTLWVHAPLDEDFIEIVTSITRPLDPYEGQFIFETDTNKLFGYGGVDWAPRDAGGQLGYAQVAANQGGITALTDIVGLFATVTVATGRRIKITASGHVFSSEATFNTGGGLVHIQEGAVGLTGIQMFNLNSTAGYHFHRSIIISPAAGSHTYKLTIERNVGAGTLTLQADGGVSRGPAFILVEDIGAA